MKGCDGSCIAALSVNLKEGVEHFSSLKAMYAGASNHLTRRVKLQGLSLWSACVDCVCVCREFLPFIKTLRHAGVIWWTLKHASRTKHTHTHTFHFKLCNKHTLHWGHLLVLRTRKLPADRQTPKRRKTTCSWTSMIFMVNKTQTCPSDFKLKFCCATF